MIKMQDVAVHAGVAQSTVSYIINERHAEMGITEETRRRVLASAAALGYRRNHMARAMVTGKNSMIGWVTRYPASEQVGAMLVGALAAANERGYTLKLFHAEEEMVGNRCVEMRLAGVLALHLPPALLEGLRGALEPHQMPVAILDSSFPLQNGIRVVSDDPQGMEAVASHLVALGHRRLGFVTVSGDGAAQWREKSLRAALEKWPKAGADVVAVADAGDYWSVEGAERAACELLKTEPTAIVCVGDALALNVMRTARRAGFRVPEAVSVVGFSDLAMARCADPPLTTVAQPFSDMGFAAVSRLLDAAEGHPNVEGEVRLPTKLVVRESTAPAV